MSDPSATALQVRELSVVFDHSSGKVRALDEISLRVPEGQFLVLIGPSGQGKSTLLRVMAGLLNPTSGEILAYGEPVVGPSRDRGLVFQQDTTFPWMKVSDNIAYGLRTRGVPKKERARIVEPYLDHVGLSQFGEAWPKQLSGGMRKRVAVSAAFVSDPKILLMDEPFGSLDFVTRASLHELLLQLWQETEKTIVFVTHDVDEAMLLADRIVVLVEGRIAEELGMGFQRPRGEELRTAPKAIDVRRRLLELLGLAKRGRQLGVDSA